MLDADSIVSIGYLPQSMVVLGGGVIACEYASVFAELGIEVTLLDRGSRPLAFLDAEIGDRFRREFELSGGRYLAERHIDTLAFDGISHVVVTLKDGEELRAEKVFAALGREPCVDGLGVHEAGLAPTDRGALAVDENGRTAVPNIYAVGDLAGPPALATSAMEQGRRAARAALGLGGSPLAGLLPVGIYSIPEIASVGLTEEQAVEFHGDATIGRAQFEEVARGQISSGDRGMLKLVADATGERLVGVHIIGEGATELVHIGQMALFAGARVEDIVDNVFNFPTMAEAYRIAALDLLNTAERKEKEEREERAE